VRKIPNEKFVGTLYCRRKRDLERVQVDTLECAKLRETREGLLGKTRRLEDLVKVAIVVVEQVGQEQGNTVSQSDRIAIQASKQGSSRSTEDTVHPVTACEQASTAIALSTSTTGQLNPPLQEGS
jgi:hypothetical protein